MSESLANEEALFNEALLQPPLARAAFLDRVCGANHALRARLDHLLQAHATPEETLGSPPIPAGGSAEERPGARIGRYKVLQKIGEGGCGVVFMADQLEPVQRRVALKIIKLGMDTREVIARFEIERQALALMDHPNIARVFDAGATETGRPYFVMELVRGLPITRYCDEQEASTAQRLDLFIQVCHAVQHAHQKGIIHRDLKPSNILVTVNDGVPVPKVIDFGIAKATQGRLTNQTVFTAFEQFVGTPAYMSPEQAVMTSLDVDTRSDIYSLGVLLYELLTGRTPFDARELAQAGLDEIRRWIRELDPPKPSTRLSTMEGDVLTLTARHRQTEPPKLLSLVRGDLDWIVMRCLEKDRARRYGTANGLAEDIQRHLSNRPVSASPPGGAYRLRKFVRRHRTGFATASAVAAALVLGVVGATWQAVRATRAETRAEAERDAAEQARGAEMKARAVAEQRRTEAETARAGEAEHRRQAEANEKKAQTEAARSAQVAQFMKDMLKGAGPRIALGRDTSLLRDILDTTAKRLDTALVHQPEVEAELRTTLGLVYSDLGDYAKALAAHQRAVVLYREVQGPESAAVAAALVRLGEAQTYLGKSRDAEAPLREAVALYRQLDSENITYAIGKLATALANQGRAVECEALLRERLALARDRWGEPSPQVANAMVGLGFTPHRLPGRSLEEAEQLVCAAVKMFRETDQGDGTSCTGALHGLAILLTNQRKYAAAEATYRELLPLWRKKYGPESPNYAEVPGGLAKVLCAQGKLAEAESVYREVVFGVRKYLGEDHPKLAWNLNALGTLLTQRGQWGEAESVLREAFAIQDRRRSETQKLSTLQNLIELYVAQRSWVEAEACYRQRLELSQRTVGEKSPQVVEALTALSRFVRERGRSDESDVLDRQVATIQGALSAQDQARISRKVASLGARLAAQGRPAEAVDAYREELARWRQEEGTEGPRVFQTLRELAGVLMRQDNLAEAEVVLREAIRIGREPRRTYYISTLHQLGWVLLKQDRPAEAEPTLRETLDLLKEQPRNHIKATSGCLAEALRLQHKEEAVEAVWREAIAYARESYGSECEDVAGFSESLVDALVRRGKFSAAEASARECVALREKLAPESWLARAARSQLGEVLIGQGKYDEAEPLLLSAHEGLVAVDEGAAAKPLQDTVARLVRLYTAWGKPLQAAAWKDRPASLTELSDRVESLRTQGDFTAAEPLQRQVLETVRRRYGAQSLMASGAVIQLADLLIDAGRPLDAEPLAREALAIRTKLFPSGSWRVGSARSTLGQCLLGQNNHAAAEPLLLAGFKELKERGPTPPTAAYGRTLVRAAAALVALYEATNQPARAAEWKATLAEEEKAWSKDGRIMARNGT